MTDPVASPPTCDALRGGSARGLAEPRSADSEFEFETESLSELVARCIASLELMDAEGAQEHLAEAALWLALMALEDRVRDELEALLAGEAWASLFGAQGPSIRDPHMQRVALGLILQRHAGAAGCGVSQRALCALSAVALACADPAAGRRLQRGFARLRLLEITEQIPVALPIRMLCLEFRHLDLDDPIPAAFVAQVEDLLDRLDAQGLLPVTLAEHPAERAREGRGDAVFLEALVPARSPRLRSLAGVLLRAGALQPLEALLAACRADAPELWAVDADDPTARRRLSSAYASLRQAFAATPFALRAPEAGYGLELWEA